MKEDAQLSVFLDDAPAPAPAPDGGEAVFDACHAGVVLRAVLSVEAVMAVAAMYGAADPMAWLGAFAVLSGAAVPATLVWLVAACALKRWMARLGVFFQAALVVLLGMAAALYGCGMLVLLGLTASAPWLASACTGGLLAGALLAGFRLRVKGRTPATTAARLVELQARIRPHFLFNTLNSAIALVRAEPAKAEALLEDLSDLFRHALLEQGESSTVAEEVELAGRYLAIEQVRFGERLRVEWSLDPQAGQARLPPLLLQPLVENAVRHGVEPSDSGAQVRVSTERRGSVVVIKVSNTVPAGQGPAGHGVALHNVRERLNLLHDVQGQFRSGLKDGVYQVRIQVPA